MLTQVKDTIVASSEVLEKIRQSGRYDYDAGVPKPDNIGHVELPSPPEVKDDSGSNLWDIIDSIPAEVFDFLLFLMIVGFLYLVITNLDYFNGFFKSSRNKQSNAEEIEEDIYEIDFPSSLDKALARGDYRMACRYIYLRTLKSLSDAGQIEWRIYKTPTQYTWEVRDAEFVRLTNHFLRIRYGDYEATRQLFETMSALDQSVVEHHCQVETPEEGDETEKGGQQS